MPIVERMTDSEEDCETEGSEYEEEHQQQYLQQHQQEEASIRFNPPVYVQRYDAVVDVLDRTWPIPINKVVDFGCANLAFLKHMKKISSITSILQVDTDKQLLLDTQHHAKPLIYDTLCPRKHPFNVTVLHGSVSDPDYRLIGCDAVVAIELIEHLDPGVLDRVPQNIFGFIKPQVAIITTPNFDFNVLFGKMHYGEFRHHDHRFEWTREQFKDWGLNITSRYPDYEVEFHGIGKGPEGSEHLGCCSQSAVFINKNYEKRSDVVLDQSIEENTLILTDEIIDDIKSSPWDNINSPDNILPCQFYKNIVSYDYPYFTDTRTDAQKFMDHVSYVLRSMSSNVENLFYDDMEDVWKIPLQHFIPFGGDFEIEEDTARSLIAKEYEIVDNCVIQQNKQEYSSTESEEEINNEISEMKINTEDNWTYDQSSKPWIE